MHCVVDVQIDGSIEVLGVPLTAASGVVKQVHGAQKPKLPLLHGASHATISDSLEGFLQHVGPLFGRDPSRWDPIDHPEVLVVEENGKRRIQETVTLSGSELQLWVKPPFWDVRLAAAAPPGAATDVDAGASSASISNSSGTQDDFSVALRHVPDTESWHALLSDQPWTPERRRQMLLRFLQARLLASSQALQLEGARGMWEMSINRDHHAAFDERGVRALVEHLQSPNMEVSKTCAAAVWGLSTTASTRGMLQRQGAVQALLAVAKGSTTLCTMPDPDWNELYIAEGKCSDSQRDALQANVLGALSVMAVDSQCRQCLIAAEPDCSTLFSMAGHQPGYHRTTWGVARRDVAAKLLAGVVHRDAKARLALVNSGALKAAIALVQAESPVMVRFCMASLLATLVLDDRAMDAIRVRGEAPIMFHACINLLSSCMDSIKASVQDPGDSPQLRTGGQAAERPTPLMDTCQAVRLAEACSQAMWGSARYCLQEPLEVTQADVMELGKAGMDCLLLEEFDLGGVCHCVAATLATLSSHEACARFIIGAPSGACLRSLLALVELGDEEGLSHAGLIRAGACTAIAFLSCHPLGAQGDDCLVGPFRGALLEAGALGALLRVALAAGGSAAADAHCQEGGMTRVEVDAIVQQSCAVGIMHLATQAGAVDPGELAMYAALMSNSSSNVHMIEYLMAGMWVLLKEPSNRSVLGSAFAANPGASTLAAALADKVNDTIDVADVNEQAEKIVQMHGSLILPSLHSTGGHSTSSSLRPPQHTSGGGQARHREACSSLGDSGTAGLGDCGPPEAGEPLHGRRGTHADFHDACLADTEGASSPEPADLGLLVDTMHAEALTPPRVVGVQPAATPPVGGRSFSRQASGIAGFGRLAAETTTLDDKLRVVEQKRKSVLFNHLLGDASQTGGDSGAASPRGSLLAASGHHTEDLSSAHEAADPMGVQAEDALQRLASGEAPPTPRQRLEKLAILRGTLPHSQSVSKGEIEAVKALDSRTDTGIANLEAALGDHLDDDWGLETLVRVGETWLPRLKRLRSAAATSGEAAAAPDVPLLKLFEFLTASMCLYVIDEGDGAGSDGRGCRLYQSVDAPHGRSWWTVDGGCPAQGPPPSPLLQRTLAILTEVLRLTLPAAWKSVQLAVVMLWNAAARSAAVEQHLVAEGVGPSLLDIANSHVWPPTLRDMAAGQLAFLMETLTNVEHLGSMVAHEASSAQAAPEPAGNRPQRNPGSAAATSASGGVLATGSTPSGTAASAAVPSGEHPPVGPVDAASGQVGALRVVLRMLVALVDSEHPLLELRGARCIARMALHAPSAAAATPSAAAAAAAAMPAQVKTCATTEGALAALVGLLRRAIGRYVVVCQGGQLPPSPALGATHEAEYAMYERDLNTLQGVLEVLAATLAALLNLSVARANQPELGRRGLHVLLSASSTLQHLAAAGQKSEEVATKEALLLDMLAGVLQNLAAHPSNRTRLYRAELAGATALDRALEGAATPTPPPQDVGADGGGAALLAPPPGSSRRSGPTSGGGAHHRAASPAAAGPPSPTRCASPVLPGAGAAARGRAGGRSPGAHALRRSVDSALAAAAAMRPKALFAPLGAEAAEGDAAAAPPSPAAHRPAAADARAVGAAAGAAAAGPSAPPASERGLRSSTNLSMRNVSMRSRTSATATPQDQYLSWLDAAFEDRGGGSGRCGAVTGAAASGDACSPLPDDEAATVWTAPEDGAGVEGSRALQRLLCRPLSHLWQEPADVQARAGKARWAPQVSAYVEPQGNYVMGAAATQLLSTEVPANVARNLAAASDVAAGNGQLVGVEGLSTERPSTADRGGGRQPLTVLQQHTSGEPSAPGAAEGNPQAEGLAGSGTGPAAGLRATAGSATGTLAAGGRSLPGARQGAASPPPPGQQQGPGSNALRVGLKVAMSPARARTLMSFAEQLTPEPCGSRPTLTVFEHVDGARVGEGLFTPYTLPSGHAAYMYYHGGGGMDEVALPPARPPARPSSVPLALQQGMPLGRVLQIMAKPPSGSPPFAAFKPVPRLVPLPPAHTLPVKQPHLVTPAAFGDLREDRLQLVLLASHVTRTQTSSREEEVAAPEAREAWALPGSIFRPRLKEADARAFLDHSAVVERVFERDWARAVSKEKFAQMMAREAKAALAVQQQQQQAGGGGGGGGGEGGGGGGGGGAGGEAAMVAALREALRKHYQVLLSAFTFYASQGGSSPYHMPLNAFTSFLEDSAIPEPDSSAIKRSDCDTIFIVCNFQPDKKSAEAAVNDEHAFMRYEFLEAIVRAGIAKYCRGPGADDIASAVQRVITANMAPNLPPAALLVPNTFREGRLYCEQVDLLLKKHQVLLKALYSRYRLKPPGGGLRTRVVRLEGWLQLMADARLVDTQFTLQDATLAFLWSRMLVVDEVKDFGRHTSITFTEFLEALARVADMKALPTAMDLADAGFDSILDWALLEQQRWQDAGGGAGGSAAGEGQGGVVDGGAAGGRAEEEGQQELEQGGGGGGDPAGRAAASGARGGGVDGDAAAAAAAAVVGGDVRGRPLYAKLEQLLDLMFRWLYWDPDADEDAAAFSHEALLRLVRKVDKDLGP